MEGGGRISSTSRMRRRADETGLYYVDITINSCRAD
jgi:hypothetical protein